MKSISCLMVLLAIAMPCYADTLTVNPDGSAQYTNLNEALQLAQPGDTLQLAPGLYRGRLNRDLYYHGGDITLESIEGPQTCVIDCESNGRFLYASTNQDSTVTLRGLTIVNAQGGSGNIYMNSGSLVIEDCVVRDCSSTSSGGVIYCSYGAQITLSRSKFFNNASEYDGGVINAWNTAIRIDHCIFANNTSGSQGAVLYADTYQEGKTLEVTNSTFHNNTPEREGAVLGGWYSDSVTFTNCIISDNANTAIYLYRYSNEVEVNFTHCLFSGNTGGLYEDWREGTTYSTSNSLNGLSGSTGNISGQPHFAEENDFHLLENSAAIDKGMPTAETTDLDGLPRQIDGDQDRSVNPDIGPYEYDPMHPLIVSAKPALVFIRDVNAPNPQDQALFFRNTTTAPLNWHLASDSPWLTVSQDSGVLINDRTSVTISVDSDGMSRGVYPAVLTLSDPNAVNSPVHIPVTLKIRGKLLVPDQFPTVAEAVNEAMPGEIIEVDGGTYAEGITLDKPLTLIGRNEPTIDTYHWIGVRVESDNCLVQGFNLSGASIGLQVSGSHNTIKDLTLTGHATGVILTNGSQNTLDQINISDCQTIGLNIERSAQHTLTHVTIENCPRGFTLTGNTVEHYQQTIDETNTVDGKPILYLVGVSDRVVAPNMGEPACVYLVDCNDVVLFRLTLSGNGHGVCLVNSTNNALRSVEVSDCDAGIWLFESPDNTLMKNTVTDCGTGIRLERSANTTMTSNILDDNTAGFRIEAEEAHYTQDIDTTNLINGLPIYYLVGQSNVAIDETTPAACIYAIRCSNLTITDQTISNNTFGIALIDCTNVKVRDVTTFDNEQSNLRIFDCTDVDVDRGLFTNSHYGIDVESSDQVHLRNVECSYNGAGIQMRYTNFTLNNSLIHHNTQYGGIRHYASSSQKGIIQGCTLIHNSYGSSSSINRGGAITGSSDDLTVLDSILWDNSPGTIPYPDSSDHLVNYSCVQNEITGDGNITDDPLITSDGHLTLGSPCIDSATPGRRIVTGFDIDGEKRRVGSNVDMGADEYLDTDVDGLPDWFERELDPNGLAMNPDDDLDGDEYTNLEEYIRYSGSALIPSGSLYVDPVNGDDLNLGNDPNLPKRTLESALEVASQGERIYLMPGIHEGAFTLRQQNMLIESIDPHQPEIVASTIIASPVQVTDQSSHVEFNGLTFSVLVPNEGSVNCGMADVLFTHCRFVDNTMAPVWAYNATITMKHCEFSRNTGLVGAVFTQNSDLIMENCLITDNYSSGYAQALTLVNESADTKTTLINCTIANNRSDIADSELVGFYEMDYVPSILLYGADLVVTNSIFSEDTPLFFDLQEEGLTSDVWVTYSNLSDPLDSIDPNWIGLGNISVDPGFVQPGLSNDPNLGFIPGDYHLLSTEGRWDPTQGVWVQDAVSSPSLGAANPAWPAQDPNGAGIRLNQGVYGNTAQQSLVPENWTLLSDLTNDGIVDSLDEAAFTQHQSIPRTEAAYLGAHPGDLDQNGDVDAADLQILQSQIGMTTLWHIDGVQNDHWSEPPGGETGAGPGGEGEGEGSGEGGGGTSGGTGTGGGTSGGR